MSTLDLFSTNGQNEAVVRSDRLGSDVWEPVTPSTLAAEERAEQRKECARVVEGGLEAAVLDFCRLRGAGAVFQVERELKEYLEGRGFTFRVDSARKMLSILRSKDAGDGKGWISYSARRGWVTLESVTREVPR